MAAAGGGLGAGSLEPKSVRFRREREASWRELEKLVGLAETKGMAALSPEDLARLPLLYRAALSSLGVARAISLDRNVLEYLEGLAGRAYLCVYRSRRTFREAAAAFFARAFPRAVARFRVHCLLAAAFLILGGAAGFVLTSADLERFHSFVGEEMAQGRGPESTTEELRSILYDDEDSVSSGLVTFAMFLFTHNAQIGMLSFALGFLAGIPVFLLLFTNGLILGAFAALYDSRGLSVDFWGWILPHGVPEILALVICGAGGLALGQSLVWPGRYRRFDSLSLRGREAGVLFVGALALFFVAGLIEGIFRQTVADVPVRYAVATIGALVLVAYFGPFGRRGPGEEAP